MIAYLNNGFDTMPKMLTREKLDELLNSDYQRQLIQRIRQELNPERRSKLKVKLRSVLPMGYPDEAEYRRYQEAYQLLLQGVAPADRASWSQRNPEVGMRKIEFFKPSHFFMIDLDHLSRPPRQVYQHICQVMANRGLSLKGFLAWAYVTASGNGLRLILKGRAGSDIVKDQEWFSQLCQLPIDAACKDITRLSFLATSDDTLYRDDSLLFGLSEPCYVNTFFGGHQLLPAQCELFRNQGAMSAAASAMPAAASTPTESSVAASTASSASASSVSVSASASSAEVPAAASVAASTAASASASSAEVPTESSTASAAAPASSASALSAVSALSAEVPTESTTESSAASSASASAASTVVPSVTSPTVPSTAPTSAVPTVPSTAPTTAPSTVPSTAPASSSLPSTSPSTVPSVSRFPQYYGNFTYAQILEAYWKVNNQGQTPMKGSRDHLTYLLASDLRYVGVNNFDWMNELIPCYDGFEPAQKAAKIRNALQSSMPQVMPMRIIKVLQYLNTQCKENGVQGAPQVNPINGVQGAPQSNLQGAPQNNLQGTSQGAPKSNLQGNPQSNLQGNPQSNLQGTSQNGVPFEKMSAGQRNAEEEEEVSQPPVMPEQLPNLIKLLVSRTPEIYRPAVAHAVFPSLATHLHLTQFRYIDNVLHEATMMNVLMAGTGAGKDCITEPINHIMSDIRLRDAMNLQREKEWKEEVNTKGANKDKKKRPEGLVIQEVDPDMTNPAFVMRTAEANCHFLYAKMNEIDQFNALKGSSGQHFQIMCLAFDPNNRYGQTRVGVMSVTEKVTVRFNWNASTTIVKGKRYFRGVLTDGPISRINFCTIPSREIGADMPVYGTYDAAFDEQLKPYIEHLCAATGVVDCPQATALAHRLRLECADQARLTQNRVYENLSFRALVIAWLKACVLYVANGCVWESEIEEFVRWSLQYDLWCKMEFFGDEIAYEMENTRSNLSKRTNKRNLLAELPKEFTLLDAEAVRVLAGMDSKGLRNMLNQWVHRGFIKRLDENRFTKL